MHGRLHSSIVEEHLTRTQRRRPYKVVPDEPDLGNHRYAWRLNSHHSRPAPRILEQDSQAPEAPVGIAPSTSLGRTELLLASSRCVVVTCPRDGPEPGDDSRTDSADSAGAAEASTVFVVKLQPSSTSQSIAGEVHVIHNTDANSMFPSCSASPASSGYKVGLRRCSGDVTHAVRI
jgi:hypothetical protein